MSLNTCLITWCFSFASAVIRLWFIYELQKLTTIAFSRNSLYSFYSRNPTCETPHAFGFPIVNIPPFLQNSSSKNPPLPFGNPRSRPRYRYGYFLELPILQKHQFHVTLILCPSKGHIHGVYIKSSINLGNTLTQITHKWKTTETWFLARLFIYQSSIISQIHDFIHWMVTILSFDHMTGENRELQTLVHQEGLLHSDLNKGWAPGNWQAARTILSAVFGHLDKSFSKTK